MSSEAEPLVLSRGLKPRDQLDLTVQRLGSDGRGVADIHAAVGPQGMPTRYTLRARQALPGDRVRVIIEKRRRKTLEGRVDALLEPAPERIEPRCQHFGSRLVPGKGCGGCTLQSLPYEAQLELKQLGVRRLLEEGGIDPDAVLRPAIGCASPWYYRNKLEFSFGDDNERRFSLGLHPGGYKHEVFDLHACYLLSPEAVEVAAAVRAWAWAEQLDAYKPRANEGLLRTLTVREGKRTGERSVELTTTQAETTESGRSVAEIAESFRDAVAATRLCGPIFWTQHHAKRGEPTRFITHHLAGPETLTERLHLPGGRELTFAIHPRAFFQPNTLQAERLYAEVIACAAVEGGGDIRAVDLYCGTGTIGLALAPFVSHVVGVELSKEAVEDAGFNAMHNGLTNTHFIAGDVGAVLESGQVSQAFGGAPVDLVVVDPPRAGLMPKARVHIEALGAPRLVYVSCNPEALVRDLGPLAQAGYVLRSVQPVDMFPQTAHIENVALLEREA